jgi:putative tryptophan/tyrosine transport system substrate-binding protein
MNRRDAVLALLALGSVPIAVSAQQARVYRVGVIHHGGLYDLALNGLRDGLRERGFEEGKQYLFHVRDARGDPNLVAAMAKGLETEKVDVIYSVSTSITLATRRATKSVPIVFYAGVDPVAAGLVEQFRKPGGRLTGIYSRYIDLTAKRLELLKELAPKTQRVVVFYNPNNVSGQRSVAIAREAARQLKMTLLERQVASVEELHAGLRALRPGEADAFGYMADAMVISQSDTIIEVAKANRMLTIFADPATVAKGALASYGESYYSIGHLSANLVRRVLLGADPGNLPIEQLDRIHFVINVKTARALGLTIPQAVLSRADEVIQ